MIKCANYMDKKIKIQNDNIYKIDKETIYQMIRRLITNSLDVSCQPSYSPPPPGIECDCSFNSLQFTVDLYLPLSASSMCAEANLSSL